jgi:hypothetical protein
VKWSKEKWGWGGYVGCGLCGGGVGVGVCAGVASPKVGVAVGTGVGVGGVMGRACSMSYEA